EARRYDAAGRHVRPRACRHEFAVLHADQKTVGRLAARRGAAGTVARRCRLRARRRLLHEQRWGPGMIDVETVARLKSMRLSGMAECFENLAESPGAGPLSGPEMIKMAVDWEYERRRSSKLA